VHITFVCSGNICRSPSAELVLRERLAGAGLADGVEVSSAGIGPWHVGDPIDPRAAEVLAGHGYPTGHIAEQVGPRHLKADLLLAMDAGHETALRRLLHREYGSGAEADPAARVRLLRSFDPRAAAAGELDVPDPYYGGDEGFQEMLEMIEAAMPGLLDWVREQPEG
jgi:protein-tyrosine phosphatase